MVALLRHWQKECHGEGTATRTHTTPQTTLVTEKEEQCKKETVRYINTEQEQAMNTESITFGSKVNK
jgi:hypothetical protein